jgi:hypothetical protein
VVGALDCRSNQMLQKFAAARFGIRIGLGGAEPGNHRKAWKNCESKKNAPRELESGTKHSPGPR